MNHCVRLHLYDVLHVVCSVFLFIFIFNQLFVHFPVPAIVFRFVERIRFLDTFGHVIVSLIRFEDAWLKYFLVRLICWRISDDLIVDSCIVCYPQVS